MHLVFHSAGLRSLFLKSAMYIYKHIYILLYIYNINKNIYSNCDAFSSNSLQWVFFQMNEYNYNIDSGPEHELWSLGPGMNMAVSGPENEYGCFWAPRMNMVVSGPKNEYGRFWAQE